jgi:Cupredoxin-like domain
MTAAFEKISASIVLGLALCFLGAHAAPAQEAKLQITVQNGHFQPAELRAPVNVPVIIVIKNNDAKPMEFESVSLRVEKVIPAKGQGQVRIRPLAPGRYDFFDDFNQSNRGTLIVE